MIRRRLAAVLGLLCIAVICCPGFTSNAYAAGYAPKAGSAHPQIVLPKIDGGELALTSLRGKKVLLIHFATWSDECRKEFANWVAKTKPLIDTEKLVVVGVAQEQHPDRVRLFAQWHKADWPILHDAMNVIGIENVPLIVAIDEHGIVRARNPDLDQLEEQFTAKTFDPPGALPPIDVKELPDPRVTRRLASEARRNPEWRKHGQALVFAGKPKQINEAITAFQHAIDDERGDAESWFAQGVAYRIRHDLAEREAGDFQAALDAWREAAHLEPNNAIYRCRLQQYGPCIDKPFAFYDWIGTACKEIAERGDAPIDLACEPTGTETESPLSKFRYRKRAGPESEALGTAALDRRPIVEVSYACAAQADKRKGSVVQIYVNCRLAPESGATWSNEGEPMQMWIEKPKTGRLGTRYLRYPQPQEPRTLDERVLSFPLRLSGAKSSMTLEATLLYSVHDGPNAPAQPMKQDLRIKVSVH